MDYTLTDFDVAEVVGVAVVSAALQSLGATQHVMGYDVV